MYYLERRIYKTYFSNHTVIGKFFPWQFHSFNVVTSLVLPRELFLRVISLFYLFLYFLSQ